MTRTDRRRFPVPLAAITALALAGGALALLFSPVQAQESETLLSYLTVVVTEDDSDPDNVVSTFTITWNDAEDCSASYNAYLDGVVGDRIHLGSAASEGEQIAASLTNVSAESMGFDAKLHCGTIGSGRLVDNIWIPEYYRSSRNYPPKPGTYSTEPGLTVLTVSSGTLTPAFHSQTLNYTVPDVANADGRITLTTTTKADYYNIAFIPGSLYSRVSFCSHGGQETSLSYQDDTGNPLYPLTDADANTPGFQMNLDEGENVFNIHVWPNCENGHVYKLTVTRAANAPANTPATGAPIIGGTAQVGEKLTADTSGIADADGLANADFTYQWLSSRDTEIGGETSSTYTLQASDASKTIKVRVSFTDDAGNEETLTSPATNAVAEATQPNNPATKAYITVVIATGDDTVSWSDPDGCSSDYNIYKAITPSGNNSETSHIHLGSAASGSTQATLAISHREDDRYPRVEVELYCGTYDAASSQNLLISSARLSIGGTSLVGINIREGTYSSAPLTALTISSGMLSPDFGRGLGLYSAEVPSDVEVITLDPTVLTGYQTDFVKNPGSYTVTICGRPPRLNCLYTYGDGTTTGIVLSDADTDTEGFQVNLDPGETRLGIGVHKGPVAAGPAKTYPLTVTRAANTPATGQPTISGTAQVGQTLTADTSGIADVDGLTNADFTYQWLSSRDTEIGGATSSTYTLQASDESKAITVQVSFTDDAGNAETLTSEATDAVAAAPPLNNPATGAPTIIGTARVGETLTVDTSNIADPDGMETDDEFAFTWFTNDIETGRRLLWWVEWEGTYRIEPRDAGKTIGVQVSFRDDRGNIEFLESAPTDMVEAAPNTPASGQPAIIGTVQVGETLTVNTSGIADDDGLTNATFSHQWLVRDTAIQGATGSTYTILEADEGKAIKVRVSFTDDAGNVETVISRATAAVGTLGICDRTEQVRDDIISMLNSQSLGSLGIKDCSEVTGEHLARIWVLDLNGGGVFGKRITSLKSGDFQGLSGLTELELVDNSLSELPEGVFDGLASLEILTMHENALGSLPDGVFDDLTNLYALALHDNELSSLSGDVFTGLGGLTRLVAANNNLTSLPDGVFSGMSKLQEVNFSGNPNAPFTLTAELERKGDEGVVVKVGEGAPFEMTVTLSAQGGTLSATTVVIDGGDTESAVVTVTPEGAGAVTVNVDSAAFPDAGTVRNGIQAGVGESLTLGAAASGICDRTEQVQDAILGRLYGVDDCADVTDSHLAGITIGLWIGNDDPNDRPALSLKSGDFAGLVNIEMLGIYYHTMDALPEDIFEGLTGLNRLYLGGNQLGALPEDVFDGLGNLVRLDLNGNQLGALPEDVFDGLGSLESLDLRGNQIGTLPENVFDGLGNLKSLYLFGNRINALPEDVFDGLGSLTYLRLSFNHLSALPDDVFDDLGNLVHLDMQENQIGTLSEGAFNGLSSLERLDLSFNEIAALPEDVFDGLGNLKMLRLDSNDLASPPEDVFDGLDSLTYLALSHNRIHTLPEDVFEGLGNLTGLSLHSNQISVLPEDVFDELGDLTYLSLDGNQLGALPEGVFDELGNLTSLGLSGNQIRALPGDFFDELGNLTSLGLGSNLLGAVPEGFFDKLGNLTYLSLSRNQIRALPEDVFDGLSNLNQLNLSENRLGALPEDVFDGLGNLEQLYLFENQLGALPEDVFDGLGNLNGLYLYGNQLSTLPEDVFDGLGNLEQLYLWGNPGTPFTLIADLERQGDNAVLVKVAEGVPFDMAVTLSATGGTLSAASVTIKGGNADSEAVTVTRSGDGPVTVSVVSAVFQAGDYSGIQAGLGEPLILRDAEGDNRPAIGTPAISGTAQVGETLTADNTGVADADGLTNATFNYQWLADNAAIAGATVSTYTLADADEGKAVKVRVTFTDDAGNDETLTSAATDAVAAASQPNSPATGAPIISGTAPVGETLTADTSGIADDDGLENVSFSYQWLADDTAIQSATNSTYTLIEADEGKTVRVRVSFTDDAGNDETLTSEATDAVAAAPQSNNPATGAPTISGTAQVGETLTADTSSIADADGLDDAVFGYQWLADGTDITGATGSTYSLADADEGKAIQVQVSFTDDAGNDETLTSAATDAVAAAPNSPATGAPTISGTAEVGETLTADTSGIADTDGLTSVSYSYQWLAGDSDISGATGSTYTLADADESKAITVQVSFTDDGGNDETLTSAATEAVAGNKESLTSKDVAAWSATMTVEWVYQGYGYYSTDAKKAGSLSPASFNVDGTTYTVKMVETQGWWMYIGVDRELPFDFVLDLDGVRVASNDASFASYSYGNIYRWEGAGLSLRDGDTVEVRLLRAFEDETAVNSAATGAPVISGTVQVGETLTADTSGVADEDGLNNAAFTYQWLADNAAIAGVTGSTYTLADADEGKAIKVQVSFTDDVGNDETLTSAATDAVSAAPTPNSPATGQPIISGATQVGETLTADTSGIADENGLENVTFSYQWLADDDAIAGATGSTHTLADADEGKAIKVQVSFTDDAGNDETLTSAATDAVTAAPQPNNPATGAPVISGTVQVGETLTADTSGVADEDGLDNAAFTYQWLAGDSDISGATGSTYALADADEGKAIKVKVSFTDDGGNDETLTSAATDAVAGNKEPVAREDVAAWSATMTVEWVYRGYGYYSTDAKKAGSLSPASFEVDGTTYTVKMVETQGWWMYIGVDRELPFDFVLELDGARFASNDASFRSYSYGNIYRWEGTGLSWRDGDTVEVRLLRAFEDETAVNSAATGAPIISGTVQVGETLTADTSGIADVDGLDNAAFTYQWLADNAAIAGATGSTYTLADDDEGKAIKVHVSFTDDAGNDETLTSTATDAVAAAPPENNEATGAPSISGTAQVGETLTVDTSGIADDDGLKNVSFSYQWLADDTAIQGATGSAYTLIEADEGKTVSVRVSFTDDTGNGETLTSTATDAVAAATQPNNPATGAPAINGTAQVGETLTADTSGIADADGLDDAVFGYQWLADGTDITGATGSTYSLADADEGKAIQVQVSFTDDGGNDETLTSAATDAVAGNKEPVAREDVAAWSATMTVEWVYRGYGYYSTDAKKAGSLSPASFEVDGTTYTVKMVETQGWWMYIGVDRELPFDFVLELDGARFASNDASFRSYSYGNIYRWEGTGLSWRDGDTVEVRLLRAFEDETAVNSAATGAPIISGTVQVGETLTADTSGIADVDGLDNAAFTYQWLADNAAIAGATGSTYTLADDDEGKAIKVHVSFTDDAGNDETLTSTATETVSFAVQPQVANSPATGAPTISGTVQVGETLTADTSGIADVDGLDNAAFTYQWLADNAAIAGATGSTYTLADDDEGKAIKVHVSFTDDAGNDETLTSTATDAVAAPEPPASPTGLSATASHDSVTLSWDDPGDDSITGYVILRRNRDIHAEGEFTNLVEDTGAAATTYTDDTVEPETPYTYRIKAINEHGESQRSRWFHIDTPAAPTPEPTPESPAEPPASPTGLAADVSHDSVTLTWDDPGDDSITGYVILRRDSAIHEEGTFETVESDTGSAETTYTDDSAQPERKYVYRIKAINKHGLSEISSWVRAYTPAAPVPAAPTGLSASASHDSVTLTWDDPGDDSITGYVILRRNRDIDAEGEFTTLVENTGGAATTYTDDSVASDTPYTYRIKAINEHGESERSRWFHIDTPATPDSAGSPPN